MNTFCRIRRVFLVLIFLAASCGAQETYFPPKVFGEGKRAEFDDDINSFLLKRLEEPSLFTTARNNKSAEVYRFLWFRTFHNPIAVRMDVRPDGTSLLTTKVADGHAGFPRTVTKLIQSTTRSLTREQTETFRRKVTTEGFWKAVSRDTGGPAATDCDGWIVEGVHNGNYHVVERAVPNRKPSTSKLVQSLGRALANELGQMDMPKDER